ncbi:DNA-processing protein DprA [Vibrio casei]|uniref:DNA-protecting protein DprA n=1 Tax=Vibrio casei TaxID=673372 RepID=A0A368LKB3_9VIBR|nr:DNA-processing protein DprA [Vibrio casei]RCS72225.1 DNA-protecting protein DprA [Vibrio casei]SJN21996.1 Rossmann fold nucleotide-binding protein Smf possibly involved in DNA uptake [Vibrio casei]
MTESQLCAWLTLSFTPKLGGVSISRLLSVDSPKNIISYSTLELQSLGLKPAQIQYIQQESNADVDQCLTWLASSGLHSIVTPLSERYPSLMKQMSSHPPVLFVKGNLDALHQSQIAIVGSRNASIDGLRSAREFSYEFASQGMVVTSGLALGIDGHAHDGALQAQGTTIAVLGSGVDQVYPSRHKGLAERIVQQGGALVSEFRPNAKPRPEHFPRRNRIISGLSQGVLVIEAAERSGSLITARYALEQNRDVFALPGSIYHSGHAGTNRLIQDGAIMALCAQDILDEMNPVFARSLLGSNAHSHQPVESQLSFESTSIAQQQALPFPQLLANVGNEPTPVDILSERTHIPVHEIMMQILELELAGHVISVQGGYILNNRN